MTTIGMRLDQLVAEVEAMPSTQLYTILLAVSVAFSFFLLNCGSPMPNSAAPACIIGDEKKRPVKPRSPNEPQPKWFILELLNYAVAIGFLFSLGMFASNASAFVNDSSKLIQFLIGWSVSLCYFFGFFGISFVDADEIMAAESEKATSQAIGNGMFASSKLSKSVSSSPPTMAPHSKVHQPLHHLPVVPCAPIGEPSKPLSSDTFLHLSNEQVADLVVENTIKDHQLEKLFGGLRAVEIRRLVFAQKLNAVEDGRGDCLKNLPFVPEVANWYDRIHGANCEIVAGFISIPVGVAGPLLLNNETVYIPMATTEGCLVASTNRGCKAISTGGTGAISTLLRDGITRAPCLRFASAQNAARAKLWIEDPVNMEKLTTAFESTTSFGKLVGVDPTVAGKNVYLRLKCFSGDAMGMNMVSKGSLAVVNLLKTVFEDATLVALSGNTCTDKKSAAINWIEGRGKSVVVETVISKEVVHSILKTSVEALVSVNINKNLIGSAMAGSIGGFNAHAANMVTAIFLATGQDPAQNVESSSCITLMEETEEGDLWMSCTMPSIEVGTVGGGTSLPAQSACLDIIGCKGGGKEPGKNAQTLAHVVAAGVMAGELSLLAALAANTLVQAHMQHNRKPTTTKSD